MFRISKFFIAIGAFTLIITNSIIGFAYAQNVTSTAKELEVLNVSCTSNELSVSNIPNGTFYVFYVLDGYVLGKSFRKSNYSLTGTFNTYQIVAATAYRADGRVLGFGFRLC